MFLLLIPDDDTLSPKYIACLKCKEIYKCVVVEGLYITFFENVITGRLNFSQSYQMCRDITFNWTTTTFFHHLSNKLLTNFYG